MTELEEDESLLRETGVYRFATSTTSNDAQIFYGGFPSLQQEAMNRFFLLESTAFFFVGYSTYSNNDFNFTTIFQPASIILLEKVLSILMFLPETSKSFKIAKRIINSGH